MPEGTQEVNKISKNPLNQYRVDLERERLTGLGVKKGANTEARKQVAAGLKILRLKRDVQKEKAKKETAETKAKEAEKRRQETTEKAGIDDLTGLSRRIPFTEQVEKEIEIIRRDPHQERGLILTLGDLDNFGIYNSLHGEHMGDKVLKGVGNKLKSNTRQTDEVCRWGGEEFGVAMRYSKIHEKDPGDVHPVERLRVNTNTVEISSNGTTKKEDISLTFGATEYEPNDNFESMLERAANALKIAKLLGKKKTVVAEHNHFRDLSTGKIYLLKIEGEEEVLEDLIEKIRYKIVQNANQPKPTLEKIV